MREDGDQGFEADKVLRVCRKHSPDVIGMVEDPVAVGTQAQLHDIAMAGLEGAEEPELVASDGGEAVQPEQDR